MAVPLTVDGVSMNSLAIGDLAPLFSLENQDGKIIDLARLRGQTVVLYFYPKALTPGCTLQACGIRDIQGELARRDTVVFGISPDPVARLRKFSDKYRLTFDLLADPDHKVAEAFGVWALKKFMGREFWGVLRQTFVIDEAGVISNVVRKVNTRTHHLDLPGWLPESAQD